MLLLCSIPYPPASVPLTVHCKQEPSSLQWPTRPYMMWDLVHLSWPYLQFLSFMLTPHQPHWPPSFPKYARQCQDLCCLVLLLEQEFLYMSARQTPRLHFLGQMSPPMRTTCLPTGIELKAPFLSWHVPLFTLFWSAHHYSCPHQPQNLPPSRSSIICDFEGLPSIFCLCAESSWFCSYMFLRWLAQVDPCKYM